MAATYELDVSLALDDLGWHFGNWHSLPLAEATAAGLQELGAARMAEIFSEALLITRQFWEELGEETWPEWYHGSSLERELDILNRAAWRIWSANENGLFRYWIAYARQFPERLVSHFLP